MVQVDDDPVHAQFHPTNTDPVFGVAVSVTAVSAEVKFATQLPAALSQAGELSRHALAGHACSSCFFELAFKLAITASGVTRSVSRMRRPISQALENPSCRALAP